MRHIARVSDCHLAERLNHANAQVFGGKYGQRIRLLLEPTQSSNITQRGRLQRFSSLDTANPHAQLLYPTSKGESECRGQHRTATPATTLQATSATSTSTGQHCTATPATTPHATSAKAAPNDMPHNVASHTTRIALTLALTLELATACKTSLVRRWRLELVLMRWQHSPLVQGSTVTLNEH